MRTDAPVTVDRRLVNEAFSLLACEIAFDRLAHNDGRLRRLAEANLDKMEAVEACSLSYVPQWRAWLALSLDEARRKALADSEEAVTMRSSSPFAGFLTDQERHALRACAREIVSKRMTP
jgi:hypothetical protein